MTDINAAAMVKFSNALSAWKVRVKRLIEKNTPLSKIFAENPSLTEAEFLKCKDTCATDEAKLRSAKFKGLQKRNTGKHRLGSRGYIGKRPIWEKVPDDGDDPKMRHPVDGSQWRALNAEYGFHLDQRNVVLGVSSDGMNPFGKQNTNHSTWPMFVWMYNIPPWKCMKTKYIHMSILMQQ